MPDQTPIEGRTRPCARGSAELLPHVMPSPQPVTLRHARPADAAPLAALEKRVFSTDRISERSFRKLLARETAVTLIAEREGEIAGYAMLLFRRGTALARLYSIGVAPEFAGSGIGRRLLDAAERETFSRGRMLLRLEVHERNMRAIDMYRRAGYRAIGKYLDYYADHGDALRFEKTVRGNVPVESTTPYYEQTTDFTCGPACLMMALARFDADYTLNPVNEIRLWREATTIFMMSGIGGCEPYGLAVAAAEAGLSPTLYVSNPGALFLKSVRDPEKQNVMILAQADFQSRALAHRIPVHRKAFTLATIRAAIKSGAVAIVLVSGYHMFGKKVPHWILAHGDDGKHIMVHDPWVEDEVGETLADAANLPVPYEQFERMSRFGTENLRAAVILKNRSA